MSPGRHRKKPALVGRKIPTSPEGRVLAFRAALTLAEAVVRMFWPF